MYEYNMFVNKYYRHFGYNLTFSNYLLIKDYITEQIDHLIMYEQIELYDINEVYDFAMFSLLKKYPIQDILNKRHNSEVQNTIRYFNNKQKKERQNSIEHNPAKRYIYDMLNEIKKVFEKGTRIDDLTNRMYFQLKHLGFKDEDILNQDCDYTMIELLRGNGLGINYKEDFLEYRKKIEYRVSNLFTRHKLDIIRRNPSKIKYDMSYQFYNSSYHQMNTGFKAALSFYLSGYSLKEANSFELDTYINDFITKDMIELNSVVELREDRYESTRVQTEEQKAYAEQLAKQKAAIWAIILSGLVLSSVAHKIIWNMPFDDKDKKEKSSFQDSNNLRDLIESKLGFAYNAEDNTISMGGK